MTNEINIQILRITPNGQNMEYIISSSPEWALCSFIVTIDTTKDDPETSKVDGIFSTDLPSEVYDHYAHGSIPLKDFNIFNAKGKVIPALYKIEITVVKIDTVGTSDPQFETAIAYISDINNAYDFMMNDVHQIKDNLCDTSNLDSLITKYFIVYAHLNAMRAGDLDEAKYYFKLIQNNFSKCGESTSSSCGCMNKLHTNNNSNCGCK